MHFGSIKPSFSYNGLPSCVAERSIEDTPNRFASSIILHIAFVADPILRYLGYVNTLSKVPVLPVINDGFAGLSDIERNAVETL